MNFEPFDRLPVIEWAAWWGQTIDRWHDEGLPAKLTGRYEICEHFGLDVYKQDWFAIRTADCPSPKSHGAGIIESEADYDRILPYLYPQNLVDTERWQAWAEEQARGDVVLWFTLEGYFWFARGLLGIEVADAGLVNDDPQPGGAGLDGSSCGSMAYSSTKNPPKT